MGEHRLRERMTPEQQEQDRLAAKKKTDAVRLVAARAKASWPSVTEKGDLCLNQLDYVHGEVVRNRHERRAAQANARKFGCDLYPKREKDEHGKEKKEGAMLPLRHGLRCPKLGEEKDERKRIDLNPNAPGWKRPRATDTDPQTDAITSLMLEKATGPTLEPVASDGGGGSTPEPTSEDTIAQAVEGVK